MAAMGCSTSSAASVDVGKRQIHKAEVADEEAPADLPEPGYPTLLEAAHRLPHEDVFDTASNASSRPTTSVSIPTPSIPASQLESTLGNNSTVRQDLESIVTNGGNSTVRGEWDKDTSIGTSVAGTTLGLVRSSGLSGPCGTSVAGTTLGRPEDIESIVGSIAESRAESHAVFVYRSASGGAISVCGLSSVGVAERDRDADLESMNGSIAESRVDSQNYLHDMETARSIADMDGTPSQHMASVREVL